MSEAIKPTPGEWRFGNWIPSDGQSGWVDIWAEKADGTRSLPFVACKHMDEEANSRLIAEAGTVHHETGLTPRQLADLNAELVEALRDMRSGWRYIRETHGELSGVGWNRCDDKAEAALAKCPTYTAGSWPQPAP